MPSCGTTKQRCAGNARHWMRTTQHRGQRYAEPQRLRRGHAARRRRPHRDGAHPRVQGCTGTACAQTGHGSGQQHGSRTAQTAPPGRNAGAKRATSPRQRRDRSRPRPSSIASSEHRALGRRAMKGQKNLFASSSSSFCSSLASHASSNRSAFRTAPGSRAATGTVLLAPPCAPWWVGFPPSRSLGIHRA